MASFVWIDPVTREIDHQVAECGLVCGGKAMSLDPPNRTSCAPRVLRKRYVGLRRRCPQSVGPAAPSRFTAPAYSRPCPRRGPSSPVALQTARPHRAHRNAGHTSYGPGVRLSTLYRQLRRTTHRRRQIATGLPRCALSPSPYSSKKSEVSWRRAPSALLVMDENKEEPRSIRLARCSRCSGDCFSTSWAPAEGGPHA
jgi:hypothetical protein